DEAAKTFKQAIGLYQTSLGPDSAEEADAYEELADTHFAANQENEAYDALNNAYRIASKLPSYDHLRLAQLLHKYAVFNRDRFHPKKIPSCDRGVELFRHAASLYQLCKPDRSLEAGKCLLDAGGDLAGLNRTTEAEELLLPSITLFNKRRCA